MKMRFFEHPYRRILPLAIFSLFINQIYIHKKTGPGYHSGQSAFNFTIRRKVLFSNAFTLCVNGHEAFANSRYPGIACSAKG